MMGSLLNVFKLSQREIATQGNDCLTKYCKVDFNRCLGQSYDNAANTFGKYKEMQELLLEINQHATYIPRAGHSLNLVDTVVVDCSLYAVKYFGIVKKNMISFNPLHIDRQCCCHYSKMIQTFQSLCQGLDGKLIQGQEV